MLLHLNAYDQEYNVLNHPDSHGLPSVKEPILPSP